ERHQLERDLLDSLAIVFGEYQDLSHSRQPLNPLSFAAQTRCRLGRSDELPGGQELGRLTAAVALVGHDRARLPWRPLREAHDLTPGVGQTDEGGVERDIG